MRTPNRYNFYPSLTLKVEASPGSDIPAHVIPEMCGLARDLHCDVASNLNGVYTIASPGDDGKALAERWDRELQSGHRPKVARL